MKKLVRPEYPELIYLMVVGKSGNAWFYPSNIPNPGDEIKVTDSNNWSVAGEGFGGSTLMLNLVGGNKFPLMGGWHSNSHTLLVDTGVDLTHKHLTHGCLSEVDGTPVWEDVGWVVGEFDRVVNCCWDIVERSGVPLRCEVQTMGGGSSRVIYPENKKEEMSQ